MNTQIRRELGVERGGERRTLADRDDPTGARLGSDDLDAWARLLHPRRPDEHRRQRALGGPGAARKVVRVLSALLTWSVGEGQLKANPLIGNQHDAPLWRACAYVEQSRWAEAREGFLNVGAGIAYILLGGSAGSASRSGATIRPVLGLAGLGAAGTF